MAKEFYQICGIDATREIFEANGFRIISFGKVKEELMNILGDAETAKKYNLWNKITDPDNAEMNELNNRLSKIVFKESRGNRSYQSIGWENGESYLRYHSGVLYSWFKN